MLSITVTPRMGHLGKLLTNTLYHHTLLEELILISPTYFLLVQVCLINDCVVIKSTHFDCVHIITNRLVHNRILPLIERKIRVQLVHNQSILLRREFYNFLFLFTWSSRTPARSEPAAFVPRVLIFFPIAITYRFRCLWRLSGCLGWFTLLPTVACLA